jgi:YggT family protein
VGGTGCSPHASEEPRKPASGAESHAMGAAVASFGVLADVVSSLQTFVEVFVYVYTILIFAYVLTSWIRLPYSFNPIQRFLYDVCEPYLRLFRRVLPPLGAIDVSPIIAVFALYLLRYVLNSLILSRLH